MRTRPLHPSLLFYYAIMAVLLLDAATNAMSLLDNPAATSTAAATSKTTAERRTFLIRIASVVSGASLSSLPSPSSSSPLSPSFWSSSSSSSLPLGFGLGLSHSPPHAAAAVTDETNTFGDNWWQTNSDNNNYNTRRPLNEGGRLADVDEEDNDVVVVRLSRSEIRQKGGGQLGIELGEVTYRNSIRVFVKSVQPSSLAAQRGIEPNFVFVSINGQSTERTNAKGVVVILGKALQGVDDFVELSFRNPTAFRQSLSTLSSSSSSVTTQIAPAGTVRPGQTQADQKITVSQLVAPINPQRCAAGIGGAQINDLLEISYIGQVVETGQVFDGSAIQINGQGIPGRGNDVTLYFVLGGKQPPGQFPPGWDVGLYGMCVGERRRLLIPPVLAYGSVGVPRRGIPPDATLQYDITLVSLNGLSIAQ